MANNIDIFVNSVIRLVKRGWEFDRAITFSLGENWTPAMESHIRYLVKKKIEV